MPLAANAGLLDGQSGTLDYLYPDTSTIFAGPYSFTAPATVITLTYGPDLVNTIAGNDIHITFGNVGYSFGVATFNGEQFIFPGLSLLPPVLLTNFSGVVVTSDAHDVWLNWQGLTPDSDSYVDVRFRVLPEPCTLLLLGSGLLGLVAFRKKFST
jgi:hypothetical protein